jgi:hypothetical protein
METEAFRNLMDVLGLDCVALAARLGGRPEHYERLRMRERLPFPIWDALQRLAQREGYAWDANARTWRKSDVTAPAA